MKTITKKQIVYGIAKIKKMDPKDVQRIVQECFDTIIDHLEQGHRFELRGFGIFEVVNRKKKIGRNPKSPETPIVIPPRKAVRFIPGKKLKDLVSK